jgi:hypothetical protein
MATIIDGTSGITFPNSTVQASAGQVLQVVSTTTAAPTVATTQTFIDTAMTATITPKFATSKILVMANINGAYKDTSNTWCWFRTMLNGVVDKTLGTFTAYDAATGPNSIGAVTGVYLSSPATTSACTYKVQIASGGNSANVYLNVSATDLSSITLMEIAS